MDDREAFAWYLLSFRDIRQQRNTVLLQASCARTLACAHNIICVCADYAHICLSTASRSSDCQPFFVKRLDKNKITDAGAMKFVPAPVAEFWLSNPNGLVTSSIYKAYPAVSSCFYYLLYCKPGKYIVLYIYIIYIYIV